MRNTLILIIILISCKVLAQPFDIKFERLTTDDGLSQSTVEVVYQDSKGFIWFGTQDGLNKFDGYQYTVYKYKPQDTTSISNNYIKSIIEDSEGYIWIGTYGGGVNRFNRKTETFTRFAFDPEDAASIVNNVVYAIYEDKKGGLWMGTKGGLCKFNKGINTFTSYQHDPNDPTSISNDIVYTITEDKTGELWVGTRNKLNLFNPNTEKFRIFSYDSKDRTSISDNDIRCVYKDSQGNIWVGTKFGGLNLYEGDTQTFRRFMGNTPGSISDPYIRSIYEDRSGNLWIGTFGGGLDLYNYINNRFYNFKNQPRNPQSISENRIVSVFQDHSGTIWLGTHGGGISYFNLNSKKFNHYFDKHVSAGLSPSNIINCVFVDRRSRVWLGTDNGLKILERNKLENTIIKSYGNSFKHIFPTENEKDTRIWAIYEDSEDILWLSIRDVGLVAFNPVTNESKFYTFNGTNSGPPNNVIDAIIEDKEGYIWIGMEEGATAGLSRFDKKSETFKDYSHSFNDDNSLSNNRVHDLLIDKEGKLWIATDYGLDKFDKEKEIFEHFRNDPGNPHGLSYNIIQEIFQDKNGTIWLGTAGGGLNKMTIKNVKGRIRYRFKNYTHLDGLANNVIATIVEDNDNNLWLSTNKGLSKFNVKTEEFRNYDKHDGLQSSEFNIKAGSRNVLGEMFFGGDFGLNVFLPEKIKNNLYKPKLAITSFKVFNKELDIPVNISEVENITLAYDQDAISIEFSALHFAHIDKNQYAFMLEGFDREWVFSDKLRLAHYTNLPHGKYTFKVKASNNDGIWNEISKPLIIEITPPYWKAPWFIFMCSAFLVFGTFALIRQREKNLQRAKNVLKEEVTIRTNALSEEKKRVEEANRKIMNQNNSLAEQKRRMQLANDQLIKEKDLVQKQNLIIESSLKKIASQKSDIEDSNDSLLKAQQTIQEQNLQLKEANIELEAKVAERTKKLREMFEEVTAANKELDTFVYRASHDLRGPISRILGLCNLALLDDEVDPKEYVRKMYKTADEMNLMLYRLLEINKLKTASLNIEKIDVKNIIDKILLNYFTDLENISDIKLDINLDDNLNIFTDGELLSIILKNLIENAIKFSIKENPTIAIDYLRSGEMVIFRVKDNGIGVNSNFFDKIFEMFFVGNENFKGAGLGLYATKMAVQKLSGEIRLDKAKDYVTVFEIILPSQRKNKTISVSE